MISAGRIGPALVSALLIFVISLSSTASAAAAEGALLRGFDVPKHFINCCNGLNGADYWPIGVAFDGNNLWYSQPDNSASDIFQTTTSGLLLRTLTSVSHAGALAWDGTNLWVGIFDAINSCTSNISGCALIFQVNVATGAVVKTLDITSIFAADQEGFCSAIDGLDFDSATGTLWVSPDIGCAFAFTNNPDSIGFVYNIDTSGKLLSRIQLPFGVAGVDRAGKFLYLVTEGFAPGMRTVVKTTDSGRVISSFPTVSVGGNHESAEDLAFDPATFGPACALWAIQDYGRNLDASLAAYQIACP